jgi:hypothetical protein
MPRVFLLSPARLDGARAQMLFSPRAGFALAHALRSREGAPIGEVFKFLSGLYFRGKLAYAQKFARPPSPSCLTEPCDGVRRDTSSRRLGSGVLVITQNRGLVPAETRVCLEHLEAFKETDVHHAERNFRAPLARDAELLVKELDPRAEFVLLGSIASKKYVEVLLESLGERLLFPTDFVGRGDMSRGGLLLRAVESGVELPYAPVKGAVRHGERPPKLQPRRRRA